MSIKHKDELATLKQLHEVEMRRVLRESDRLRRIIARAGGISNLNSSPAKSSAWCEKFSDPEPSKNAPIPTPRSSIINYDRSDKSKFFGRSYDVSTSGRDMIQCASMDLDVKWDEVNEAVGDVEFKLDALNDTLFEGNMETSHKLHFDELQDYLEEDAENSPYDRYKSRKLRNHEISRYSSLQESISSNSATSNSLISISPDVVTFHLETKSSAVAHVTISNNDIDPVAFKIVTTQPSLYSIKRNQLIVNPGEEEVLEISLQSEECNRFLRLLKEGIEIDTKSHAFNVYSRVVTPSVSKRLCDIESGVSQDNTSVDTLSDRALIYQSIWDNESMLLPKGFRPIRIAVVYDA